MLCIKECLEHLMELSELSAAGLQHNPAIAKIADTPWGFKSFNCENQSTPHRELHP